jgi:hypothetical protein
MGKEFSFVPGLLPLLKDLLEWFGWYLIQFFCY